MYCAASVDTGSDPHGMWPCEYFRTKSKCACSSTLLKKGNAAEKMKVWMAANRHNSRISLRSFDSDCAMTVAFYQIGSLPEREQIANQFMEGQMVLMACGRCFRFDVGNAADAFHHRHGHRRRQNHADHAVDAVPARARRQRGGAQARRLRRSR